MKKFSFILIIIVFFTGVFFTSVDFKYTSAQEKADEIYEDTSIFVINNLSDWRYMLASKSKDFLNKTIRLNTDLVIYYDKNIDNNAIGEIYFDKNFSGTFDGGGHSLIGLKSSQSIFNNLTSTAIIKNLNIYDAQIGNSSSKGIRAILSMKNEGVIQNVNIDGILYGEISATFAYENLGKIQNCYSTAKIVDTSSVFAPTQIENINTPTTEKGSGFFAGLVYTNNNLDTTALDNSYFLGELKIKEGSITAELCFQLSTTVPQDTPYEARSNPTGLPFDKVNNTYKINSLLDFIALNYVADNLSKFANDNFIQTKDINCYNTSLAKIGAIGDNVYDANGMQFLNCLNSDDLFTNPIKNTSASFGEGTTSTTIVASVPTIGEGIETSPYIIKNSSQLAFINSSTAYFVLANDIIINSYNDNIYNSIDIATFDGTLDGNGYMIIGVKNQSLIGKNNGTIKNLTIRGYNPDGAILATTNNNIISNVNIYGTANSGVTLKNTAKITDCSNFANVLKGIAEENNGTIEKCRNLYTGATVGIAPQGSIQNCYTTSKVLAGESATITSSIINDNGLISATNIMLTPDNQKYFYLYTDFDFINIWSMDCNNLPILHHNLDNSRPKTIVDYSRLTPLEDLTYSNDGFDITQLQNFVLKQLNINDPFLINMIKSDIKWQFDNKDIIDNLIVLNCGQYQLSASYAGDQYYTPFYFYTQFEITKADIVYSFSDKDKYIDSEYNSSEFEPNIMPINATTDINDIDPSKIYVAGMQISYQFTFDNKNIDPPKNVGKYSLKITISSDNYQTEDDTLFLEITQASLAIKADDKEIIYKGTPVYSYTIVGLKGGDSDDINANSLKMKTTYTTTSNVGDYVLTPEQLNNLPQYSNYNITFKNGKLTVKQAQIDLTSLTFADKSCVYNGVKQTITAEGLSNDIIITYNIDGYKDVGVYTIEATFKINNNYIQQSKSVQLTITKAQLTLTAVSFTIDYLSDIPSYLLGDFVLMGTDTVANSFTGALTIACAYTASSDVGNYDIIPSGYQSKNYDITWTNGSVTVNKISYQFSINNLSRTYNGSAQIAEIDNKTLRPTYTYNGSATPPIYYGDYKVIATVAETKNYLLTSQEATMTIAKANYNNTIDERLTKQYDKTPFQLIFGDEVQGSTYTIEIKYNNELVSVMTDCGSYGILISISGNPNYNNKKLTTTLTITPRTLILSPIAKLTYNTLTQSPVITIANKETVLAGDEIEFQLTYPSNIIVMDAKNYTVKVASKNTNYIVSQETTERQFIVEQYIATLDLSDMSPITHTFGLTANFEIELSYLVGEITLTHTIKLSCSSSTLLVGNYNIDQATSTVNCQFQVKNGKDKYIITPRLLTFDWVGSDSLFYNGAEQNPFTIANIIGALPSQLPSITISYDQQPFNQGDYTAIAKTSNKNYKLDEVNKNKSFTIKKLELTIGVEQKKINFGDASPAFTPTYNGFLTGEGAEKLLTTPIFDCSYRQGNDIGEYVISVRNATAYNYNITFIVGALVVEKANLVGVTLPNKTVTFDFKAHSLTVVGAPSDATITYSNKYVNVGTYTIYATIVSKNYFDVVLSATLTITQATPAIVFEPYSLQFKKNHQLGSSDILGSASYLDITIDGLFTFSENSVLLFGENFYLVSFLPFNSNIQPVVVSYKIVSSLPSQDITIELPPNLTPTTDGEYSVNGEFIIRFPKTNSDIKFYVNNEEVLGDKITLSASTGEVIIEARIGDIIVFRQVIPKITISNPTNKNNTLIIILSSIGGGLLLIGGIIAIILIKMRKS